VYVSQCNAVVNKLDAEAGAAAFFSRTLGQHFMSQSDSPVIQMALPAFGCARVDVYETNLLTELMLLAIKLR